MGKKLAFYKLDGKHWTIKDIKYIRETYKLEKHISKNKIEGHSDVYNYNRKYFYEKEHRGKREFICWSTTEVPTPSEYEFIGIDRNSKTYNIADIDQILRKFET